MIRRKANDTVNNGAIMTSFQMCPICRTDSLLVKSYKISTTQDVTVYLECWSCKILMTHETNTIDFIARLNSMNYFDKEIDKQEGKE